MPEIPINRHLRHSVWTNESHTIISIGEGAFAGCKNLSGVELPEGLISIGRAAFDTCAGLERITIPASVETIEDGAFLCCTNLKQMEVAAGNTNFKIYEGCLYTDSEEKLIYCPAEKEAVSLSENLKNIGDYAFAGCSKLGKVELPAHVTRIGYHAFLKCCALTGILIPESVTEIGYYEGFNPEYDSAYVFDEDSEHQGKVTIYGAESSYAKTYADQYSIPFQPMEEFSKPDTKLLSECQITLSSDSYVCDGTEKRPVVTVKDGEKTLTENTDYTISSYEDNINAGTARVILNGIGSYTGTATAFFTIQAASTDDRPTETPGQKPTETPDQKPTGTPDQTPTETPDKEPTESIDKKPTETPDQTPDDDSDQDPTEDPEQTPDQSTSKKTIGKASVKLSKSTYTYTGRSIRPAITVKIGKTTLKANRDYTVSYKNNKNIGKATVTVTGRGSYKGKVTKTFKIAAKKGASFTIQGAKYKILNTSQVAFTGVKNARVTKVTIPATVKIGGKTFKVTTIAANALKNKKNVTTVTVGKNVTSIGANAFSGCKKLETITIQSKRLKSIGKNACKGIKATAKIKAPKVKVKAYRKLLKNKGQGSKVKIVKR